MLSTFGDYLRHLRKRAGMSQHDLAAATGYSRSMISALEQDARLPDLEILLQTFVPALGLQDEPLLVAHLLEMAALARGERPPASVTRSREHHLVIATEEEESGYRLPHPPTEIVGREREVHQLCRRLLGHHGRLLTVVGPPGVGKTRLSQAIGAALQGFYKDGASFVSLAAVRDPALVAVTLLAALKFQDGSPKSPERRLIEVLRRKELLLILDNFEQIIAAAPFVAELLAECAGLRLVVTSRERLHLRAEQRYRVPPLEVESAVELFARRATAVDANFALTAANRPQVAAICQRLDRLPLAIELCAAQVDLLSLPQLMAGLQDRRLALLVEGASDLPPQHRTLRHAIFQSYQLLNEDERSHFRRLAIFAGGFDLPALERVCARPSEGANVAEMLHALIGKSLVYSETLPSGEQRYLLLETIREFAGEQLRLHGEEASLRREHFDYYLRLFRNADSHLHGPEYPAWSERLKPELDNLRAALQGALDEARYHDAAWLMLADSYFLAHCGLGYEEARWLAQLLPYRQALPVDLRLAILLTFYRSAFAIAEFQPVEPLMAEIMQLLEECPYTQLHAIAWGYRAWTAPDVVQAAADLEQSIALANAAGESPRLGLEFGALADRDFIIATEYFNYAALLSDQGELARAASYGAQSLQLFKGRGNRTGIGECLGLLGRLALLQGDLPQAHKLFADAVAITTSLNFPAMQYEWQAQLALTNLYRGDVAEARRLLAESYQRSLDERNMNFLTGTCAYLAETALWDGKIDEAEEWLAQSFSHYTAPRTLTLFQVEHIYIAAAVATAQRDFTKAATLFGLAEAVHRQLHHAIAGPIQSWADATLATVRQSLDGMAFAEAFAVGGQQSFKELFTIAATQRAF